MAAAAEVAEAAGAQKLCDLIQGAGSSPWIALEFFPPKTETGVANLYKRLDNLKSIRPLYIDFTWGAGGSTSDLTLELTEQAQERFGYVANMHLTCTNMPREKLDNALKVAQQVGISNILALRGDPPVGQEDFKPVETGFSCALDLVKHIRKETGDTFCISVAGYPEGHPDRIRKVIAGQSLTPSELGRAVNMPDGSTHVCSDKEFQEELAYLKAKVDAGAQAIVTQMFYDVQVFIDFVRQCRAIGITVPIIPGIICMTSYGGFQRMCGFCKTRVPAGMAARLETVKDDDNAFLQFAIEWGIDTCKRLLDSGANGLHFYTLNVDKVVLPILEGLGLTE
mmetsp:Transcript_4082/g.7820  ORF Transcript_4082/g.7820 Transcript_4082/m.7820 type:complete len:338 (+) Transcript_4082:135-1148(+)